MTPLHISSQPHPVLFHNVTCTLLSASLCLCYPVSKKPLQSQFLAKSLSSRINSSPTLTGAWHHLPPKHFYDIPERTGVVTHHLMFMLSIVNELQTM